MKQFVVIGLGNFGSYLAKALYQKGHEVLAIDKNEKLVQSIMENVNQAAVADTTDKKILESLGVKKDSNIFLSVVSATAA